MCPECIPAVVTIVAGATSTGAVSAFLVRSFARMIRGTCLITRFRGEKSS